MADDKPATPTPPAKPVEEKKSDKPSDPRAPAKGAGLTGFESSTGLGERQEPKEEKK